MTTPTRCRYNLDAECPEVRTIADLAARHLGRSITLAELVAPGADWNEPRITVTGKLVGMRRHTSSPVIVVDLVAASGPYHDRLPLTYPVQLEAQP